MNRIDSHQHFWNYDPSRQNWMTEDMQILKRDYTPDDLFVLLEKNNLQGSVAVQASQTEEENDFLVKLSQQNPIIKGIVGWVDLQSPAVTGRLAWYKTIEKIKGFRHVIHDEKDIDFMLRPAFLNGIRALQPFGFTYDILIYHYHLPNTIKLVSQFPDQPFVIDHIAKPDIKNKTIDEWKKQLTQLASFQHVYCKISGMVTEAEWMRWHPDDFIPYIDTVVELFGTKRIMYGSDWPVCTLSASYDDTYGIVKTYFDRFSPDEQEDFFGGNATRFYQL